MLAGIPGLVHGFEQRRGPTGEETRDESRRRVAAALADSGRLLLMKQVHGATVRRAPWDGAPEGDAALSTGRGLLLGIETADCLPVLLVDPWRSSVAAAHAGWRGTLAGVVRAVVAALLAAGSRADEILAVLGPSIGSCCYEVGDELRPAFAAAFGGDAAAFFRPGPRGRDHFDLRAANVRQLEQAGIQPANIHHVADCTHCRPDLYHSYRRDGPGGGRMLSFVGWQR